MNDINKETNYFMRYMNIIIKLNYCTLNTTIAYISKWSNQNLGDEKSLNKDGRF